MKCYDAYLDLKSIHKRKKNEWFKIKYNKNKNKKYLIIIEK